MAALEEKVAALEGQVATLTAAVDALQTLQTTVTELQTTVASQDGKITTLETAVAELQDRLQNFSRVGNDIFISGANLNIRDGSGATWSTGTFDAPGIPNGYGNLIIGYNEANSGGIRTRGLIIWSSGHTTAIQTLAGWLPAVITRSPACIPPSQAASKTSLAEEAPPSAAARRTSLADQPPPSSADGETRPPLGGPP